MMLLSMPFFNLLHGVCSLRTTYRNILRTSPGQLTFGRDMVILATYLGNWHQIHLNRQKNVLHNTRENPSRIEQDY